MWPCFQPGDLLVAERIPFKQLRLGDCIIYRKTGEVDYIVHRIVLVKPALRTRGDARRVADDDPVLPAWIRGRVKARLRHGRMTRVSGGLTGVWAGRFYRYAGRIEPSRNSKGGKLARLLQTILGPISAIWMRRTSNVNCILKIGCTSNTLTVGNRVVAVYDERVMDWSIVWPYSLWIHARSLLCSEKKRGKKTGLLFFPRR
jgi:hypothetical protein